MGEEVTAGEAIKLLTADQEYVKDLWLPMEPQVGFHGIDSVSAIMIVLLS